MFIPIVPHTTVENKTIVYSDTVLPIKDLGNNLKVSTISNVSEYSLENCLQTIFKSNPNVIFNTIQYSKNNQTVYFYTNQEITTEIYEESRFFKYKPITSSAQILEEVKSILLAEKNNYSDCISLYDVAQLLKELEHNYNMMKKKYQNQFQDILAQTVVHDSTMVIYDFDYKNKLLKIGYKRELGSDYEDIYFAKKNDDLYIAKSKTSDAKVVFAALSSGLSKLYNEFMQFADYHNSSKAKYNTNLVNSNFRVNIDHFGVRILVKSKDHFFYKDFELSSPSYSEKYSLNCNSGIVCETLQNKEEEIFKKSFVKIDNCPKWSQATLYEMRKNQLAEEQRIEEQKLLKKQKEEAKKEKRLKLKRKIFPFLKK